MILHSDNNAAYLVLPISRIRILVHFYLRNHLPPTNTSKQKLNGTILTVCQTLKHLVES